MLFFDRCAEREMQIQFALLIILVGFCCHGDIGLAEELDFELFMPRNLNKVEIKIKKPSKAEVEIQVGGRTVRQKSDVRLFGHLERCKTYQATVSLVEDPAVKKSKEFELPAALSIQVFSFWPTKFSYFIQQNGTCTKLDEFHGEITRKERTESITLKKDQLIMLDGEYGYEESMFLNVDIQAAGSTLAQEFSSNVAVANGKPLSLALSMGSEVIVASWASIHEAKYSLEAFGEAHDVIGSPNQTQFPVPKKRRCYRFHVSVSTELAGTKKMVEDRNEAVLFPAQEIKIFSVEPGKIGVYFVSSDRDCHGALKTPSVKATLRNPFESRTIPSDPQKIHSEVGLDHEMDYHVELTLASAVHSVLPETFLSESVAADGLTPLAKLEDFRCSRKLSTALQCTWKACKDSFCDGTYYMSFSTSPEPSVEIDREKRIATISDLLGCTLYVFRMEQRTMEEIWSDWYRHNTMPTIRKATLTGGYKEIRFKLVVDKDYREDPSCKEFIFVFHLIKNGTEYGLFKFSDLHGEVKLPHGGDYDVRIFGKRGPFKVDLFNTTVSVNQAIRPAAVGSILTAISSIIFLTRQ